MQNAKPRLWYDNTNPRLVAAVQKLHRNTKYAAHMGRFDAWVDRALPSSRIMMALIGFALTLTIKVAFGPNALLWTIIGLLVCIAAYRIGARVVRRQEIRRGTYGFAAMWDYDAEWQKLTEALAVLGLNFNELMAHHPDLIRQPISDYLTSTVPERRAVRTNKNHHIDPHQAAITLSTKAQKTAIAINASLNP